MAKTAKYYGTGRRKKSIARVYLVPGKGDVTINKRSMDDYFGLETLKVIVRQPLVATDTADKFDIIVNVKGGGYTGQAGAIRHGVARALLQADAEEGRVSDQRSPYEGEKEVRSESCETRASVQQEITTEILNGCRSTGKYMGDRHLFWGLIS